MPKTTRKKAAWRIVQLDWTLYDHQNRAIHHPTLEPSWQTVREAILQLDGASRSDLVFEAANGDWMCVGGGNGRYVVTSTRSDLGMAVVNAEGSEEVAEGVVVGGCQTDVPERFVVDRDIVCKAAERFFVDGELEPSLTWEEQ